MATQVQTLRTNGFSALAGLKLGAHGPTIPLPPVKAEAIELEESPASDYFEEAPEEPQEETMAQMIAREVAKAMASVQLAQHKASVPQGAASATVPKGKRGQTVQIARHAKPSNARIETPKETDSRPWHIQALTRSNKKTGEAFYHIEPKSVMVAGQAVIARSTKWAPAVLLIQGRRKPIYLNANTLAALADAGTLLASFAKANHEYLAQSLTEGDED